MLAQAANRYEYNQILNNLHLNANRESLGNLYHKLLTSLQTNDTSLIIANRIYVQDGHPLNEELQNLAKEKFFSDILPIHFADAKNTTKTINRYVQSKTNGKIHQIVTPELMNVCAELVLVNAIYFKANWLHRFDKQDTVEDQFHMTPNKTIPVQFMTTTQRFRYGYLPQLNASMLEMRYAKSNYTFVIVLPQPESNLTQLEKSLNYNEFNTLSKGFGMVEVTVKIPKFKIEFELNLKKVLIKVCVHFTFSIRSVMVGMVK